MTQNQRQTRGPETKALALFRAFSLMMLVTIILVFTWKSLAEKKTSAQQSESSRAFAWMAAFKNEMKPETTAAQTGSAVTTRLKGYFSPGNESELIKQLSREGYMYFSSYRLNADSSAVIKAMNREQPVQSFVIITVKNNGDTSISME